jgi:HK97 gp10 family phage protein
MIGGQITIDLTPLEGLKKSLANKILRKAVTQAGRVVRDAVKANAVNIKKHGYLAKSIGIKVKVYKDTAIAVVGPRSKWSKVTGVRTRGKHKGEPITYKPSYTAHLVEKGTKRSQQKAFLKPALNSTSSLYMQIASDAIAHGIQDQLSKS